MPPLPRTSQSAQVSFFTAGFSGAPFLNPRQFFSAWETYVTYWVGAKDAVEHSTLILRSMEVEELSPEQPFSKLALPQGVACLGRTLWARKAWAAPLQGPLSACRASSYQALFTA